LLFGMLIHSKEWKLCLEDLDGTVELDFSQLVLPAFFFLAGQATRMPSLTTFSEPGSTERRAFHRRLIRARGGRLHGECDIQRDRGRAPAL
jgi:hypothetical protein